MSEVEQLYGAFIKLQEKNRRLVALYQDNLNTAPADVSRDALANIMENEKALTRAKKELIGAGYDEDSLGVWPYVLAGAILLGAVTVGASVYLSIAKVCDYRSSETDKRIEIFEKYGKEGTEAIWGKESPIISVGKPAAAGFGLGTALAVAFGLYVLLKS